MQSLSVEKRWHIIIQWKQGSLNVKQIARHLHCHISTVYRIINHYRLHRNVDYQHSTGRPPTLSQAEVKTLDKTIRKNRSATATDLLLLTKFNTTERTIQRDRLSLGYRPRISAIKVQTNRKNEEKRYRFAELHHRANIKKYIFEDELEIATDEACNSLSLSAVQHCIEKTQRIYLRVVDQY